MIVWPSPPHRAVGQDDIRQNKLLESLVDFKPRIIHSTNKNLVSRNRAATLIYEAKRCLVCQTHTYTHTYICARTHVCTRRTYESMFVTCEDSLYILRLSSLSSLFHRCVPLGTVNFPKSTSRYSRRYSTPTQPTACRACDPLRKYLRPATRPVR